MPKILISYHRADAHVITQTLYFLLCQYFGIDNIVLDANEIPGETDRRQYFAREIARVDILLVIIGRQWMDLMGGRANQENDSIRYVIETALRQKKIVIPILVQGANIPDYAPLPDSIRALQWINTIELRSFPNIEEGVQHVIMAIEDVLKTPGQHPANEETISVTDSETIPSFKDLISGPATKNRASGESLNQSILERIKSLSAVNLLSKSFDWISIPPGKILIKGDRYSYLPEDFQKNVFVESFSITRYPVTNLQYAPYVSATGNTPEYWTNSKFNKPRQPVVGISWFDVMAYCDWLSEQLGYEVIIPTEHQWQRAAQGDDACDYPWGNRWNSSLANTDEKINHTTPVHQYPGGASPYGLMDMAGNVWEWCFIEPEMQEFVNASVVLCGGSWLNYSMFATVHARNIRLPNMSYSDAGFRLSRASK